MRHFLKIQNLLAILLVASLALAGTSCKKKKVDPPTPDTPPTLTALESIKMDFSDFDYLPTKGNTKIIEDTYINYTVSYNSINFWSTMFDDVLAVPVAGYANALTKTGLETATNTFEWALSFSAGTVNYTGTLKAVKGATTFSLELNAAPTSSPSSVFKYFDAVVSNDQSSADWNIYKDDMGSVKVLDGEWSEDGTSGFKGLLYTYVESGQTETNSVIEYNYIPGADYNGAYYLTMSTGLIWTEWDKASKAGRVKSQSYFADSEWHCWNDVLADITCPVK